MSPKSQDRARPAKTQRTKMKHTRRSRGGSEQAVEQLNNWCKSGITLRLVVLLEPFSIWHDGTLSKINNLELYFFHPDHGGGTFNVSPLRCRPAIHRSDFSVTVSFRKRKGKIGLNLMELLGDARSAEEVFRAHSIRTGFVQ